MAAEADLGNVPPGVDTAILLYYNIRSESGNLMSNQPHRHAHPVHMSPSLLRMSAPERLVLAGVVILVIWAAVFWTMS
jgi:hypothetical protein